MGQLLDAPLDGLNVLLGLGRLGADVCRVAREQRRRLVEHLAQPDDLLLVLPVALVDLVEARPQGRRCRPASSRPRVDVTQPGGAKKAEQGDRPEDEAAATSS